MVDEVTCAFVTRPIEKEGIGGIILSISLLQIGFHIIKQLFVCYYCHWPVGRGRFMRSDVNHEAVFNRLGLLKFREGHICKLAGPADIGR